LKGSGGHDILLGGEGDDLVVGGDGRDLLIGGLGADRIVGNADDDIIIAGTTVFDGDNGKVKDKITDLSSAEFAADWDFIQS